MKRSSRFALCVLATVPLWLACSDVLFEGGGPLSITLSADKTTLVAGDTVSFSYDAVGTILQGVIMQYGDGVSDSVSTSGAQTVQGHFVHVYPTAGTFTATATVYDGQQGTESAQATLQVSEPASTPASR